MQNKNLLVFTLASVGILVGWQLFMGWMYPPIERPKPPTPPSLVKTWPNDQPPEKRQQALAALAVVSLAGSSLESPAALALQFAALRDYLPKPQRWPFADWIAKELATALLARPLPAPSTEPKPEVIQLGGESGWFLRVKLTNQGAAVRQVVLNEFQEADIYGLPVQDKSDSTKLMPLELVPEKRILMRTDLQKPPDHEIEYDLTLEGQLHHYQLYDYPTPESEYPVDTLGKRNWRVVSRKTEAGADRHEISFTADVRDRVRITKTFTLSRGDYHVGLSIKVQSLIGEKADQHKFRYQLAGARGLPIEGAWYTYTYRNALVGWVDQKGGSRRHLEDSRQIAYWDGGEEYTRDQDRTIRYAGVAVQFFAAVVAVAEKENQPGGRDDFIKSARATHEGKPHPNPQMSFLDDVTVRLMSEPLPLEPGSAGQPGQAVEHNYVLYHGPVKVKLLHYLKGDKAVAADLVDRYEDALQLRTLTDHHSPGNMGKFADTIGMTWLVIQFTNVMHWLLHKLHWVVPIFGLNIIMLTLMVRGLMFPISRRQALANQKMQEKMGKLAPEVKKLQEKYKDDPMALNQARNQLYMENGINPLSAMGGCLLIFAQMPVFLGLYYALQESIFFRLEPLFSWFPRMRNLAAPDMLVWWSEKIPMISDPNGLGGMFYLGPYFNLLPCIAVALMLVHQIAVAPPPTDEQQEMQMKMMKWMTVFFGFMFYKVAAGLCIYFIASSIWGLAERKLLPKSKPAGAGGGTDSDAEPARAKPDQRKPKLENRKEKEPGGWKQKFSGWWQGVLKEASKQQQARNTDDRGKKKR